MSKTFETWYGMKVLFIKLRQNGINDKLLALLTNYLNNRKQRVVVGGSISQELNIVSGVPQGSILDPLLFILFINDLQPCVSANTNIALYADDTKIWRTIDCEQDCIELQNDIDCLVNWSVRNCMSFHPQKCKILSINHKH